MDNIIYNTEKKLNYKELDGIILNKCMVVIGQHWILVRNIEMGQYFYSYLHNIGLDGFVDDMIEKLKREKTQLEQNIILAQKQNDILLNL